MWTEDEEGRVAAELVDMAIVAAGGDVRRAEAALRDVTEKHGTLRPGVVYSRAG
jgi:hypothetical protein